MRVTANGIEVHFEEYGSPRAPAVVLSHSLFTGHAAWGAVAEGLSDTYRVIAYDLRGHGETQAPEGPYTVPGLADDVAALLDALEIERAHFVGVALGGMIGQVLAARHPDRIQTLTLAATRPRTPPEMLERWQQYVDAARRDGVASQIEPFLLRWLNDGADPALRRRLSEVMATTSLEGFVGGCEATKRHDAMALLGEIKAPTLVLTGSKDTATSPAIGDILAARIRGAVHETIADCGHQIALQRPEAFLAAVRAHLRQDG